MRPNGDGYTPLPPGKRARTPRKLRMVAPEPVPRCREYSDAVMAEILAAARAAFPAIKRLVLLYDYEQWWVQDPKTLRQWAVDEAEPGPFRFVEV